MESRHAALQDRELDLSGADLGPAEADIGCWVSVSVIAEDDVVGFAFDGQVGDCRRHLEVACQDERVGGIEGSFIDLSVSKACNQAAVESIEVFLSLHQTSTSRLQG